MKKNLNTIAKSFKKVLALLFVLLLACENFAAVVSDNDGSAFITKAEFDSLKNNFQSQLNQYNTSIDGKIDTAISSYLAGIKTEKTTRTNIINSSWDDVSAVNGEFETEWNMPEMAFTFLIGYLRLQGSYAPLTLPNANWIIKWLMSDAYSKITPDFLTSGGTNKRNLVTNEGTNDSPTKITWAGRALRYHENWALSRMSYYYWPNSVSSGWDLAYLDLPNGYGYAVDYKDFFKITAVGNLQSSKNNLKTLWPFQMIWYYGVLPETHTNAYISNWNIISLVDNLTTSITLEKDASGKTTEYDHIIVHDGATTWRLFNTNYNYCNAPAESTLGSDAVDAAGNAEISVNTDVFGSKTSGNSATDTATRPRHLISDVVQAQRDLAVTMVKSANAIYPNLGVIKDKKAANLIYQDQVTKIIDGGGTRVEKAPVTLEKGFQLLASKKDDVIEWTPIFNYTHAHNGTSTYAPDNTHEVDIYFSDGPFTNKTSTTKPIKVKVDNDTALKDYATTTNRTCKIKFTMPSDGLVYVKFVPHFTGTSYLSSDWIVTLDIKNSNSYTYTRE